MEDHGHHLKSAPCLGRLRPHTNAPDSAASGAGAQCLRRGVPESPSPLRLTPPLHLFRSNLLPRMGLVQYQRHVCVVAGLCVRPRPKKC